MNPKSSKPETRDRFFPPAETALTNRKGVFSLVDPRPNSELLSHSDLQAAPSRKLPLRIVHVLSSLNVGGMEQFVVRLADAQRRQGHEVSLFTLHRGPLLQRARDLGLPVHLVENPSKPIRTILSAAHLRRCQPDILHVHNTSTLHYAVLGKRVSGAKVVMTHHGQGLRAARHPSQQEWRRTDAIVAVSKAVALKIDEAEAARKTSVICNGVDLPSALATGPEIRERVRASLHLGRDAFVGTLVARIDRFKGHETLIRAAALLRHQGVAVTFLLAGDGPERMRLENLAEELGLGPDRVRFLGFRSDVPDLLAASDFFALPSLTEGLPLSVLEAMGHRLPVIATPVGGVPELVTEGRHGLLVPVDAPESLACAVSQLSQDADLRRRFGEAAYQKVKTDFSFETMLKSYETLYASLLIPRGSRGAERD